RVLDSFVLLEAQLKWKTESGQHLNFLFAPAVLTQIEYPQTALQLSETQVNGQTVHRLSARQSGDFEIRFHYQVPVVQENAIHRFVLPTPAALVNRLRIETEKAGVEVFSPQAVSVQSQAAKRGADEVIQAELILAPVAQATIGWKPRERDTRTEKPVFYAELVHLFIPTAGIVEGLHEVQVRPAQGELSQVNFQVPAGLTITDVQADFVASWRFDPDQRRLHVQFNAPQSRAFALRVRSQLSTSPLPYEQGTGLIAMMEATGQVGLAGVATGSEVQLDQVQEEKLSAINLEDFPASLIAEAAKQIPGLTLRRAFRYADATARLVLAASAVQPDVRVETHETLSLGEDRHVLAVQFVAHIARAGIFKLSFALPADYEIESVSGQALSHWTELKSGNDRIITLHLRGKTEGDQNFSLTLTSPGMGSRAEFVAPRVSFREASKQTGQVVVVPELGMRLHVKTREGIAQLDPQKAGVTQKGVLAFRLLHGQWQLAFDVETVDPWVQLTSLQDVTVREGQLSVSAQLNYQIENAGVKALLLQLPAQAQNVRFDGDLISDTVRSATAATNRLADWEIRLQRRVIGDYPLRITYHLTVTNQAAALRIDGFKARNANLHRGYLAVHAGGRLQIQFPQIPQSLQRTEWQSIPLPLRRGREAVESKDTFSTLEPDFSLPVQLSRHEIARVLPARVEKFDMISVVASSGEMLTEGRLELQPGDKRLLRMRLPASGQFWYAFVNGQSAAPWRDGDQILLLLDKNSDPAKPTVVEFFYISQTGGGGRWGLNPRLLGPSFDLPLENITWKVYVPQNWKIKDWESTLQLRSEAVRTLPATLSLDHYIETETGRRQANVKQAENLLQLGNEFLQNGVPQQARKAYQAAWRMSPQDAAFNEDARVQLHNLKMQQALLGLNQRRQLAFEYREKRDGKPMPSLFNVWTPGQAPAYTQQQVQQVLEQNPAEDNAALVKLAERLVRQQDAAVGKPEAIRAALPAQGKELTFTGSLQVETWADLRVQLEAKPTSDFSGSRSFFSLALLVAGLGILIALARPNSRDVSVAA
ncbi:MAG: hypothetical protein AB1813_09470, partial [Verrucomicrobiota bacterium]